MLAHILRPAARRAIARGMQVRKDHHGHSHFKYPTFDEACAPEGPWKENYEKLQRKYNIHLAAGVGSLVASIFIILQNELIYFNYIPPKALPVDGFVLEE